MNFTRAQKLVDELIREFGGYWTLDEMILALSEEVGELSREALASKGLKKSKSSLNEEIGDVLFALICISNKLNVNLDEALRNTVLKYQLRDGKVNKPSTDE